MEELLRLENVKNFFNVDAGVLKAVNGVDLTILGNC